jgi:hypothetical protein
VRITPTYASQNQRIGSVAVSIIGLERLILSTSRTAPIS